MPSNPHPRQASEHPSGHHPMPAAAPRPPVRPTIDDLDADICRLAQQINSASYRLLMLVREFDDRLGWAKWSFTNCAEWLAWRCGLSLSAAREKVRAAQALRELPAISAAFADGRLSYSKVRALTRAAELGDEQLLLDYALQATAAQVEERCRQIRNVAPESAAAAMRRWMQRSLTVWRNESHGTMTIKLEVPVEEGELIAHAIDRAVAAGEAASGPEFAAVDWHAQQADALVAVAKAYLGGEHACSCTSGSRNLADGTTDADSSEGEHADRATAGEPPRPRTATADHYQVFVHVDETALRGGPGRTDLPLETVRRLLCDGSAVAVVEDERGTPLSVGRKQRMTSASLKRALWARDRGCAFPGCHRMRYVDAHHIRHWADGGETSLDNLTLLCSHHHRLLHEGSFSAARGADGTLCFRRADGRVIPPFGYRTEDVLDDDVTDRVSVDAAAELAEIVRATRSSAVRVEAGPFDA